MTDGKHETTHERDNEIEVSDEMLQAGLKALSDSALTERDSPSDWVAVKQIYMAMAAKDPRYYA